MVSLFRLSHNTRRACLCLLTPICMINSAQKTPQEKTLDQWRKAVVNIETEGFNNPKYRIDSVIQSRQDAGCSQQQLDSVARSLQGSMTIRTGTAIFITYKGRKYLITAEHVLLDSTFIEQKIFEKDHHINDWDKLEAIYPRISIRTPFDHYSAHHYVNNFAVITNSFLKGPKPYFFITDSVGDGIGLISLQARDYKALDNVMTIDGYSPIPLEEVIDTEKIAATDDIYAIGFPELISIVAQATFDKPTLLAQSADLVIPFTVKGSIAMYQENIQHFYVDLTIAPGNSGSPVIRKGDLIGLVSSINTYRILGWGNRPAGQTLFGIGHLVNIINTANLERQLDNYRTEEDQYLNGQ